MSDTETGAAAGNPRPVSIVIPTWNGRGLLERFLPSVLLSLERYPGGGEVLVVDDGGTDGTPEFLAERFPELRVEVLDENNGFAGAANTGVRCAAFDLVLLLNNDVETSPGFIGPLVRAFEEDGVFAACARSLDWDHQTFRDGGKVGRWKRGFWRVWENYDLRRDGGRRGSRPGGLPSFYCPGGFALFDRRRWLRLGGLDELFSPFNWEDTDICYRALKRGWKVLYAPDSEVYHSPNTTIGGLRGGYVRFISRRNRYLFHWKNITCGPMLAGNVFHALAGLPLSILRLDPATPLAFAAALARLGPLMRRRAVEKREAVVSDRELRDRFAAFIASDTEIEVRRAAPAG